MHKTWYVFSFQFYSYVCYASKRDISPQLGYFFFLSNKDKTCPLVSWNTCTSKRGTKSGFESEVMAIADEFDLIYPIYNDVQWNLQKAAPLNIFTDSQAYLKCSLRVQVQEKRNWYSTSKLSKNAINPSKLLKWPLYHFSTTLLIQKAKLNPIYEKHCSPHSCIIRYNSRW